MDSRYTEQGQGGPSAYGAGGATGHFDPIVFLKKPQVILRLFSLLFSIVVFGCIFSQGDEKSKCNFNYDNGACGYGEAVGIMAFVACCMFLPLDAFFDNISNVAYRKWIVLADIAISGLMSFLWFVCFCYLTNSWRISPEHRNKSAMEAVLAFSFFSTGCFIAITTLAVLRYREGVDAGAKTNVGQESYSQPGDTAPF